MTIVNQTQMRQKRQKPEKFQASYGLQAPIRHGVQIATADKQSRLIPRINQTKTYQTSCFVPPKFSSY